MARVKLTRTPGESVSELSATWLASVEVAAK